VVVFVDLLWWGSRFVQRQSEDRNQPMERQTCSALWAPCHPCITTISRLPNPPQTPYVYRTRPSNDRWPSSVVVGIMMEVFSVLKFQKQIVIEGTTRMSPC